MRAVVEPLIVDPEAGPNDDNEGVETPVEITAKPSLNHKNILNLIACEYFIVLVAGIICQCN